MKVLIAGGSGFIGQALTSFFRKNGHDVSIISRNQGIRWNPSKELIDKDALENADVVINLAGESLLSLYWTKKKKKRIYQSRIQSTRLLAQTIQKLQNPPKVFINASGLGYYGDGFLSEVCNDWEKEARQVEKTNTRLVILRLGIVISPKGGFMKQILPFARLGINAILGSGNQRFNWISLDDVIGVTQFAIDNPQVNGAYDLLAPEIQSNATFTQTLAKVLKRYQFIRVPAVVLRFLFGELAKEMMLDDNRQASAQKLLDFEYKFIHPNLRDALETML